MKASGPDSLKLYTYRELPIGGVSIGMDPAGRKTGLWRYNRPSFVEKIPPCEKYCPLGNWIQKFIAETGDNRIEEAWHTLKLENPFPGVCGRVCPHPCEESCNRKDLDGSISIRNLERFIASYFFDRLYVPTLTKAEEPKEIAVIGSGPAGLSFSYFAALMGHKITIFESRPVLGGIPRFGIPAYRLPREILDKEISDILSLCVEVRTNCQIGKDLSTREVMGFSGVFIATGAHQAKPLGIPGEDLPGVCRGWDILQTLHKEEGITTGMEAIVIGGGNVAMDVARSLIRKGYQVRVIYRRTRQEMPAFQEEIAEAEEEGVEFSYLLSPVSISSDDAKGLRLECQRMELKGVDASGRPMPVSVRGDYRSFPAAKIVVATGEAGDLSYLPNDFKSQDGVLWTNALGQTSVPHVFAGGDMTEIPRTVAEAIGSGKRSAIAMDAFFKGRDLSSLSFPMTMREYLGIVEKKDNGRELAKLEDMATAYCLLDRRNPSPAKVPLSERISSFTEVNGGYSQREAIAEAQRCLSCGHCKMCGNCYLFCPDAAVKLSPDGTQYYINYDYCKGCGICQNECPVGAVISESEKE
jgi:NADPH-dependent glutamate synthase beta subunit-like oxidoreductase